MNLPDNSHWQPERPPFYRKNISGFSLIELMIAMVLGLILLGAVIQFFAGTKLTYTANEALARTQESGRFALEAIKPIIRGTGIQGICGGTVNTRNHLDLSDSDALALLNPDQAIGGWEFQATGPLDDVTLGADLDPVGTPIASWTNGEGADALPLPLALQDRVVPASDVLLIRELRPVTGATPDGPSQNANTIGLNGTPAPLLEQCDLILITDCTRADLFQKTNAGSGTMTRGATCDPSNLTGGAREDWSKVWDAEAQIYRPTAQAFYIGIGSSGEPALFRAEFSNGFGGAQFEELVDGIESMQILYGYSNPGTGTNPGDGQSVNQFLTADEVPNWEYVIAVQISLLARSPGNVDTAQIASTFDLALTQVTHAQDRRLRQPYTTTLTLRNRQIVR